MNWLEKIIWKKRRARLQNARFWLENQIEPEQLREIESSRTAQILSRTMYDTDAPNLTRQMADEVIRETRGRP